MFTKIYISVKRGVKFKSVFLFQLIPIKIHYNEFVISINYLMIYDLKKNDSITAYDEQYMKNEQTLDPFVLMFIKEYNRPIK